VGVHLLVPYDRSEAAAARARSEAAGRLNGDVRGACVLVPDGGGERVALVAQLSVQRDEARDARAACAAALLQRCADEAKGRQQDWLVVPALPVHGGEWLASAGFAPPAEDTPEDVRRAMGAGALCRRV
jgi:N-acetylglutamate synthase-like GNAT family acetyltransferase